MVENISEFVLSVIEHSGYLGIFVLMALESVNIPIPSEIIMPFSGFLVSEGKLEFISIVTFGALGNLFGSLINYFIGVRYGRKAAAILSRFHLVNKSEIEIAERLFKKFGIAAIFLSRMLPVIRTFISFPAGMFKLDLAKFSLLTFSGSFIWSTFLSYLGFVLGENWVIVGPYFRQFDYLILLLVLVLILFRLRHYFGPSRI